MSVDIEVSDGEFLEDYLEGGEIEESPFFLSSLEEERWLILEWDEQVQVRDAEGEFDDRMYPEEEFAERIRSSANRYHSFEG